PDPGLPFAEIGGLGPGRAVDDLRLVHFVDRQIARHSVVGRAFEAVAPTAPDARNLEDGWHVIGVVDAVEFGLELGRDVHLHNIEIGHGFFPWLRWAVPRQYANRVWVVPSVFSAAADCKVKPEDNAGRCTAAHKP